ncbi:MAG TPA: hypothetical protein VFA43_07730 [Gemmatimonadaceae bacterium]|nr:hypothetical protein [Gemmatimonadaceae bacterium]
MLDAIGTIGFLASAAVILVTVTHRKLFAGLAGAYFGLAAVVSASGLMNRTQAGPLFLLALFSTPLIVAAIASRVSSTQKAMLSIPMATLIGLNVIRAEGALFLFLAGAGRLAGPFPYSAGWGDIITGVAALPLAWAVSRGRASGLTVAAWNIFGTLDLIVAVTLGVLSANGSPVQLIHAGVGSLAITQLPWAWIPTVLVPFFLVTHAIIFAKLRAAAAPSAARAGGFSLA